MRVERMILCVVAVAMAGTVSMAQMGRPMPQPNPPGMGQPNQPGMGQPDNMPGSMSRDTTMRSPDQMFVVKAAQGGIAEVNLGNLAKQNGGSDAVKQFGDKMVTDHSQANEQLKQLAQQKGIDLPKSASSKDKKLSKTLEAKQGPDFDKAYIHDMVKDHEADVAEFRNEAKNGQDPDVKAWAQKTLPTLEQHLATAKQVAEQVGADKKPSGVMSSQY
jgi:putative membrane protein